MRLTADEKGRLSNRKRRALFSKFAAQMKRVFPRAKHLVVLAGANYAHLVVGALPPGVTVETPLQCNSSKSSLSEKIFHAASAVSCWTSAWRADKSAVMIRRPLSVST
jgi:hypothetical protein